MCNEKEVREYEQDNYIDPTLFSEDYPDIAPGDTIFKRLNNYIISQGFTEHNPIHSIRNSLKNGYYIMDRNWGYSVYYFLYRYLIKRHGSEDGFNKYIWIRYGKA